jgi:hypothetical protein
LFIGFVVHLLRDFEQNCEENGGFVGDFELWRDFDFFLVTAEIRGQVWWGSLYIRKVFVS